MHVLVCPPAGPSRAASPPPASQRAKSADEPHEDPSAATLSIITLAWRAETVSRWWKCDLQVATPGAPGFRRSSPDWDLSTPEGRSAAADDYMAAAAARGIEVVVLADHNSCSWAEVMVAAGRRAGIWVFPGVEVTTASGSDGVHLIIFGGPNKTSEDFARLLAGACGFDHDYPLFQANGSPASSPRTTSQILDGLPDDLLAIAPHAFNDNGIASKKTLRGDLRWKALHHPRLGAIDPGDIGSLTSADSWHARFARRELDDFPCIDDLAFVSTSDAYSLEDIGSRFTWIRMQEPSIEGLRQAFLDHEARIICDWDSRVQHADPNEVSHAWIEEVSIASSAITPQPVSVPLDPRLNVIIGGRGAGKSTIVAAIRCLYGDTQGLPSQAKAEAERFVDDVFGAAAIEGRHALPHSGESQAALWTKASGSSVARPDGTMAATNFKVRVINQKELFERAATSATDPHVTSRNLLNLVDDALASVPRGPGSPADFRRDVDEATTAWVAAARRLESERAAVSARAMVSDRVEELTRQVAAFDNDANRLRRLRNDRLLEQATWFDEATARTRAAFEALRSASTAALVSEAAPLPERAGEDEGATDLEQLAAALAQISSQLHADVVGAISQAQRRLGDLDEKRRASGWHARTQEAQADHAAYLQELASLGLDPSAYEQVRAQLSEQQRILADIDRRSAHLAVLEEAAHEAWLAVDALLEGRRVARAKLLEGVAARSEMLRFRLSPRSDETAWVARVRDLVGLRSDGFLDEVPALAEWLWRDTTLSPDRLKVWQRACLSGEFGALARDAKMRAAWANRLESLDPLVRARVAAEIPDDTVTMEFLRQNGDPEASADWQDLTAGSPGQRSAAMLSFVMHYGTEPLVLDQPEDDLDTEWITELVVRQLRVSRWTRQLIVVTHNANIPVNADAERVIVFENLGSGVRVRRTDGVEGPKMHLGPLEDSDVRTDIQRIMEGGIEAFVRRERRYNNELNTYRAALHAVGAAS